MAIRPIRLFPDPLLSQECKPVEDFDQSLMKILQDLIETLYHSPGVGLAAPQIGILSQVSVIDTSRSFKIRNPAAASEKQIILINPHIESVSGSQTPREGCLSVPHLLANIQRYESVTVSYRTPKGGENKIQVRGFDALAFQHEIDHLHGKLFLDRVANLKTDIFRRKTYRKIDPN